MSPFSPKNSLAQKKAKAKGSLFQILKSCDPIEADDMLQDKGKGMISWGHVAACLWMTASRS